MDASNALLEVTLVVIREFKFSLPADIIFQGDLEGDNLWFGALKVKVADEKPSGISRELYMLDYGVGGFWLGFKFGHLLAAAIVDEDLSFLPYNEHMLVGDYNDSLDGMVNWYSLDFGNIVGIEVSEGNVS